MTDTTDIKALLNELRVTSTEKAGESEVARRVLILFDQLEAERQRADAAQTERNTALRQASAARNAFDEQYKLREKEAESAADLYTRLLRTEETLIASNDLLSVAEEEIAALKGKIANPVVLPVRAEHAAWSQETFGDVGPVGPLKHLSKEAIEAAEAPDDLSEWADMQFLFWDAQRRAGISDSQIIKACEEKLVVNKARTWPAPKDGEPRLHVKSFGGEQVPVAWRMWPEDNYEEGFIVNHDEDPVKYPTATDAKGQRWVSSPLYDRPQKPVVLSFEQWLESKGDNPLGWVREAMKEAYDAAIEAAGGVVKDGE